VGNHEDDDTSDTDDFDRDITGMIDEFSDQDRLTFMFAEIHESFRAMLTAGFTEKQALRLIAFTLIHEGDA